jgi:hypothetical protein
MSTSNGSFTEGKQSLSWDPRLLPTGLRRRRIAREPVQVVLTLDLERLLAERADRIDYGPLL